MADAQLTYTVQIDVSGSNFGAAFSATNVSSKAVAGLSFSPITATWGRQDQFSTVTPTTVVGSFQNSDGTFSPGNVSGTYYPRIKRGLRRRLIVGVNSTTVNVSDDYASSLEVIPSVDSLPVTNVTGTDILGRFGGTTSSTDPTAPAIGTTMRSFLAEEMLLDSPTCLYMMQEASGATSFADVTSTDAPLVVKNSKYGAGTIAAGQSTTGANPFAAGTMVGITNPNYGTTTLGGSWLETTLSSAPGSAYTVEMWLQMPTTVPAASNATILELVTFPSSSLICSITSGGAVQFDTASLFSQSLCDGKVHQIVGTVSGTTGTLYVDGVSVRTATHSFFPGATLVLGMTDDNLGGMSAFTGAMAFVALYPTALSAARILAHYQAGSVAFAGIDTTDQRVTRLLSYRTNTGSSLDTGLSTMGLQSIQGRSLQDCLLEVGTTEGGVVFVDGLGQVNFRSRSRLFNPTPTVTLDMKAGGVNFGSNWREDTQNVLNDVTLTNATTGSDQRSYSSSSITSDGEYSTSLSLPTNTDNDAANLAGWMVINGTQQQLTATPLVIDLLHLTASQAQAVLQLKPLDCVRLTNCPTPAPASTMTFIVEGGTTSLAADAAAVTLNVTPVPYPVGVWDSTNWDAAGVTWAF